MSARYAERLGVSVARLEAEHRSLVETLFEKDLA
jgi:hypothetical protein